MRNSNGFGSVYRLSGSRRNPWAARVTVSWKMIPEKKQSYPVYKFVGYFPTRADALKALVDYHADPDYLEKSMTFEELYTRWSEEHFPKISEKLQQRYQNWYDWCPTLHSMKIRDIRLDDIQQIADASGKTGPTQRTFKYLLGSMYDYAVTHEYVDPGKREMVKALDVQKAGNPNSRKHIPFTHKELKTLWDHSDDPKVQTILILIYTGVRIDEYLSLDPEDLHLKESWFYIRKSKTKAGIREVPIADKIKPFFHLCPCSYGNYIDTIWNPVVKDLRFKVHHTPHDTRHTCISLLTEAEVDPRMIRQIVGHAGTGVTENVYTHIPIKRKLEEINKI